MILNASIALNWILFLALFPIAFFWFRRAWRILFRRDFSEVALKGGMPPANPARYAPYTLAINLIGGVVIVFTIFNTVSMTVVERVKEIGTIRAMGFRRGFVGRLFLAESALTGLFGAGLALALGVGLSRLVNSAGVQWTPPSNATPLTVRLMVLENPTFAISVLLFLVVIAVLAAVLPTFRAARLNIVQSLQRG